MFQNKMLMEITVPESGEVRGKEELRNDALHNLYYSLTNVLDGFNKYEICT